MLLRTPSVCEVGENLQSALGLNVADFRLAPCVASTSDSMDMGAFGRIVRWDEEGEAGLFLLNGLGSRA